MMRMLESREVLRGSDVCFSHRRVHRVLEQSDARDGGGSDIQWEPMCVMSSLSIFRVLTLIIVGMSQNWDNPAFEGVFEFCSLSAGGSVGV